MASMRDLCPEDKGRVAKLIQVAVQANQQRQHVENVEAKNEDLEARLDKLRQQNSEIIQETASLRAKFAQSLKLLRKYQEKLSGLQQDRETEAQKREEMVKSHVKETARLQAKIKTIQDRVAIKDAELEVAREEAEGRRRVEEQLSQLERRHRDITKMQEQERARLISELKAATHQVGREKEQRALLEGQLDQLTATIKDLEARLKQQENSTAEQHYIRLKVPPSFNDTLDYHEENQDRAAVRNETKQKPNFSQGASGSPSNKEISMLKAEVNDMRRELLQLRKQKQQEEERALLNHSKSSSKMEKELLQMQEEKHQEERALLHRRTSVKAPEFRTWNTSATNHSRLHLEMTPHQSKTGLSSNDLHHRSVGLSQTAFDRSRAELRKSLEKRKAELMRSREDLDRSMSRSMSLSDLHRRSSPPQKPNFAATDERQSSGHDLDGNKMGGSFQILRRSPAKRSIQSSDDDSSIRSRRKSVDSRSSHHKVSPSPEEASSWWDVPADVLAAQHANSGMSWMPDEIQKKQPSSNSLRQLQSTAPPVDTLTIQNLARKSSRSSSGFYDESLFDLVEDLETALTRSKQSSDHPMKTSSKIAHGSQHFENWNKVTTKSARETKESGTERPRTSS